MSTAFLISGEFVSVDDKSISYQYKMYSYGSKRNILPRGLI